MDQNAHGRRPHYHSRGRRGSDRRGPDRRQVTPPSPAPQPESAGREHRDHVDVEQLLREIRARIAKGSGVDLTNAQIQELAARRLEAVLDPRSVKPALLDALRRGAAAPDPAPAQRLPAYEFDEPALYASENGLVRLLRKVFSPLLKLLFNPAAVARALHTQTEINAELAARDAGRDRRQAEWNALQFEMVQKMVTETARVSIDLLGLAARIESLAAKVDFNERRVRSIEGTAQPIKPASPRAPEPPPTPVRDAVVSLPAREPETAAPGASGQADSQADGAKRRRRRRRGRRSGGSALGPAAPALPTDVGSPGGQSDPGDADLLDVDEVDLSEPVDDEPPPVIAEMTADEPEAVTETPATIELDSTMPAGAAPIATVLVEAPVAVGATPVDDAPPEPVATSEPAPQRVSQVEAIEDVTVAPTELVEATVAADEAPVSTSPEPAPAQPTPPRDEALPAAPVAPAASEPGPQDR